MKQSPHLAAIQERMRPGVITAHGFLGADARTLAEIIETDGARVARLGLTHASIAARMRELHAAGAAGLGEFIDVPPHFEVRVDTVRGAESPARSATAPSSRRGSPSCATRRSGARSPSPTCTST